MKIFKIFSLVALMALMFTACDNGEENGNQGGGSNLQAGNLEKIYNEWRLVSVNGVEAEFDVYLKLSEDKAFDIYQMVYAMEYRHYMGTFSLNDNLLSGEYLGGKSWKCDYRVGISEDEKHLTMESVEDNSITCIYEVTTIPEDVKAEAVSTRAAEFEPFL